MFTDSHGLIPIVVRGGRRPTSPHVASLRTFVKAEFNLYHSGRSDFYHLSEVNVLTQPANIISDRSRFLIGAVFVEVITKLAPPGMVSRRLFHTLESFLQKLESGRDSAFTLLILFLVEVLRISGYLPSLRSCLICGSPGIRYFSAAHGGCLCAQHGGGIRLDDEMVEALQRLDCREVPGSPSLRKKVLSLLVDFYHYHIGEPGAALSSVLTEREGRAIIG